LIAPRRVATIVRETIMRFQGGSLLSGVAGLVSALVLLAPGVAHAKTVSSATFRYTGSEQTFVVPPAVSFLDVEARGADGGSVMSGVAAGSESVEGGLGAVGIGTIRVRPHEQLYVEVGGRGADSDTSACPAPPGCMFAPGGFGGGGNGGAGIGGGSSGAGGGGASDIQTMPAAAGTAALSSRLIVAAGGGGAGGSGGPNGERGGAGGDGDASGMADPFSSPTLVGQPGGAGTSSGGGAGGAAGELTGNGPGYLPGQPGQVGMFGVGANGGGGSQLLPCPGCSNSLATSGGGGGGGGGVFGGGGGGSGAIIECGLGAVSCTTPDTGVGGGGGGGGFSEFPGGRSTGYPSSPAMPGDGSVEIFWGGQLKELQLPGQSVFAASPAPGPASKPGASLSVREQVFCLGASGGVCQVAMKLTVRQGKRTTTIGTANVRLADGASTDVTIKLNPAGARLLRARHPLKVTLLAGGNAGAAKSAVGTVQLT
jgi:hypothetical protein